MPIFSIFVQKAINKIAYATILLQDSGTGNHPFSITNDHLFAIGKEIDIELGYKTHLKSVFKGIIIKQRFKIGATDTSYLNLYCKDIAYRTTLTPKTIGFTDR